MPPAVTTSLGYGSSGVLDADGWDGVRLSLLCELVGLHLPVIMARQADQRRRDAEARELKAEIVADLHSKRVRASVQVETVNFRAFRRRYDNNGVAGFNDEV